MQEINNLKVQIFDIIRQQEVLQAQTNQLEQVKRNLVTKLNELEKYQAGIPIEQANAAEDRRWPRRIKQRH